MTMTTTDELKQEANKDAIPVANRCTILYGDYGKRKTSTACRMINERGLLISSDDSWKVLLNERHSDLLAKTKIITLEGLSQFAYIDFTGYDTIIWDTVSRSVSDFRSLLLKHAKWPGNNREKLSSTHKELKDLENTAIADYLVIRDKFAPVFDKLFKLDASLIFVSQMTEPIPGLAKDQRNRPALPAATFQIIAERADLIANIRPENGKFKADLSENTVTLLAKSRIEGLQGKMDLDDFVNKYREIVFK